MNDGWYLLTYDRALTALELRGTWEDKEEARRIRQGGDRARKESEMRRNEAEEREGRERDETKRRKETQKETGRGVTRGERENN